MARQSVEQLKGTLRGELIQPGDTGYDAARKVYNAMIDRRPRLVLRCADVADVMAAVRFGAESGMPVAIRSGGHNAGGLGVCDDGLVVDLSRLRGIRVDPQARTVRVEAGCTLGDVDHATHAFGMAVPDGIISTTGNRRAHLGRWPRPPHPQVRPDHRQSSRGRRGAGRRKNGQGRP